MLSAKRIIRIFSTRGGGTRFTRPSEDLTPDQMGYVKALANGEPIIAKVSPANEWLVVTRTDLVIEQAEKVFRVPLHNIARVEIPKPDFMNPLLKAAGGNMRLVQRDGTTFSFRVEPGGPYFGLLNVLMRIAAITQHVSKSQIGQATNDQRPTTQQ